MTVPQIDLECFVTPNCMSLFPSLSAIGSGNKHQEGRMGLVEKTKIQRTDLKRLLQHIYISYNILFFLDVFRLSDKQYLF